MILRHKRIGIGYVGGRLGLVFWFAVGASMSGIGVDGMLFSPGAHYSLSQTCGERDSITFFFWVSAETVSS
jgi:hypothetical protein